jgi:hypothetical protein
VCDASVIHLSIRAPPTQVPESTPSPEASNLSRSGSARKVNNASSRLLAPTASYLTRVSSCRKDSKAARDAVEAAEREKKAKELKKVMQSPQVCFVCVCMCVCERVRVYVRVPMCMYLHVLLRTLLTIADAFL